MKKFNSLEQLKSILPNDFVSDISKKKKIVELEAHFSLKGRAGKPVVILKGFVNLNRKDLKLLAKSIQSKLGIGGSVKNETIILQGDKRNKLIEILKEEGFKLKVVGG
tara:strand:+ start:4962 stop:5285 length:324 start_codon:yes stop_codon:yes gene_type:complete